MYCRCHRFEAIRVPWSAFNSRKHSPFSNRLLGGTTPHDLIKRRHGVVKLLTARTMPSVTRCSKADNHPSKPSKQAFQRVRRASRLLPQGSHGLPLDTTILHVVNELAANHLGARTQSRSWDHEQRILRAQRGELSFSAICHQSFIQWFVGLFAVHTPQRQQLIDTRSSVDSTQRLQSVLLLCHFWRHDVTACRILARCLSRVRRRSRARCTRRLELPARISRGP